MERQGEDGDEDEEGKQEESEDGGGGHGRRASGEPRLDGSQVTGPGLQILPVSRSVLLLPLLLFYIYIPDTLCGATALDRRARSLDTCLDPRRGDADRRASVRHGRVLGPAMSGRMPIYVLQISVHRLYMPLRIDPCLGIEGIKINIWDPPWEVAGQHRAIAGHHVHPRTGRSVPCVT